MTSEEKCTGERHGGFQSNRPFLFVTACRGKIIRFCLLLQVWSFFTSHPHHWFTCSDSFEYSTSFPANKVKACFLPLVAAFALCFKLPPISPARPTQPQIGAFCRNSACSQAGLRLHSWLPLPCHKVLQLLPWTGYLQGLKRQVLFRTGH